MKKKSIKKSELKKIDTVHNEIDKLFPNINIKKSPIIEENDKIIFDNDSPIIKERTKIIEEKPNILKQEKTNISKTAIEKDIQEDEINIIQDKQKSDLLHAMDNLQDPKNLESNTILTNNQVIALSVINYLAQAYDVNFFKVFVKTFPRYRISGDDGRGRKEIIEIANAIRRDKEEEHQRFMEVLGRR